MTKTNHLTKAHLDELKNRLLKDRIKIQKTIEVLEAQDPFKDPNHVNDNAAIDTDIREQMGHDTVEAEIKSLRRKLRLVEKALKKMERGTYGFDEKTGAPIPYERLSIVPEAQHVVEVAKKLVK